jgi:hypothetical protein
LNPKFLLQWQILCGSGQGDGVGHYMKVLDRIRDRRYDSRCRAGKIEGSQFRTDHALQWKKAEVNLLRSVYLD